MNDRKGEEDEPCTTEGTLEGARAELAGKQEGPDRATTGLGKD